MGGSPALMLLLLMSFLLILFLSSQSTSINDLSPEAALSSCCHCSDTHILPYLSATWLWCAPLLLGCVLGTNGAS